MNWSAVTKVLLLIVIVVLASWTIVMTAMRERVATVSYNVMTYSLAAPVLVLALGVLLGHWLWPRYPGQGDWLFTLAHRYPILLLPLGALVGRLLWSQTP